MPDITSTIISDSAHTKWYEQIGYLYYIFGKFKIVFKFRIYISLQATIEYQV